LTSRALKRIGHTVVFATLAVCAAATPALAQAAGTAAGGNIGAFIENIISILNSSVIRGLAVIAIIVTGIAWMFGHLDLRRAGAVIVGIIVIFSAASLVDLMVGAS
jgi:type IV secretion system protein VirB2